MQVSAIVKLAFRLATNLHVLNLNANNCKFFISCQTKQKLNTNLKDWHWLALTGIYVWSWLKTNFWTNLQLKRNQEEMEQMKKSWQERLMETENIYKVG